MEIINFVTLKFRRRNETSVEFYNLRLYKGERRTHILTYEATVLIGSIPFVMFLTWQTKYFGRTKRRAFLIAFFLCCMVLVFPWALRKGLTIWWVLSIVLLLMIGTLFPSRHIDKDKLKNNSMACEPMVSIENNANQELINQALVVQASICELEEDDKSVGETREDLLDNGPTIVKNTVDPILVLEKFPSDLKNEMSLEELIDLGFKAKYSDNFDQAALYFSWALALDPKPDIAFYLILDCYWLWSNLGERKYAHTQLDEYVKIYLHQFNPELRHQFDAWMTREDIHIN